MSTIEVKVPALGEFKDVPIIEVLVKPGDAVGKDDALVTLESDKATMDVPSPEAGVVRELKVKVGDRVSEGRVVLTLDAGGAPARKDGDGRPAPAEAPRAEPPREARREVRRDGGGAPPPAAPPPSAPEQAPAAPASAAGPVEIKVPAIGDFKDVPVIEVLVKAGDRVKRDDPLVTLESEKATMDVPSPAAGVVRELKVKAGDHVSEGSLVLVLDAEAAPAAPARPAPPGEPAAAPARPAPTEAAPAAARAPAPAPAPPAAPARDEEGRVVVPHASPSVRKLARELGVDLGRVEASGPRGRILHEDVQRFVKEVVTAAAARGAGAGAGLDLAPWPKVDFAKFGPVETRPLSRIKKISRTNLARNWVMIPHVTQHDEADVTELEKFRVALNAEHAKDGVKVTLLAFLVKACVAALRRFPDFNASLVGDELVLKSYFHIGFAADTPGGLVVPVVKDADRKGVLEIARELAELAAKARDGKLQLPELQGGTFSISSLGGIGGTSFTPIINAPEVAILGVSRSVTKPVWDGTQFAPRLMLPLSLSYDHRVVDGAAAARFTSYLAGLLADMRRVML